MFCPYPDVWLECAVADHWLLNNNSIYSRVLFPQSVMDVDIEKIRFKQIALTDTQQFTYQSRLELTVTLASKRYVENGDWRFQRCLATFQEISV